MTRFLHLHRPLAYPFFDLVLRDTNDGPCFDLSVLLEDYTGSVYLRDEHVIEMARALGMATTAEVDVLKAHIESLERQISRLPAAQEELKNGLANLVSKFHDDLLNDNTVLSVDSTESEPDNRVVEETERETVGPVGL